MRAFLIDPIEQAITEVDYNGVYTQIYEFIEADTFDVATFNERGDGVFVDDNGLFKRPQEFFAINGYLQPLAGKGLVLGVGAEGESISPTVDMEWLENNVRFMNHGS